MLLMEKSRLLNYAFFCSAILAVTVALRFFKYSLPFNVLSILCSNFFSDRLQSVGICRVNWSNLHYLQRSGELQ